MDKSKLGKVWVETVIYTLIGLSIIGILLAVLTPKINSLEDKAIITQSIDSMNAVDQQVQNILLAPGNKREVFLSVRKGEYTISSLGNNISYVLRGTNLLYSQAGQAQKQGQIIVLTQNRSSVYDVYLTLDYSNFNITYSGKKIDRTLTAAPTPYHLLIENLGGSPLMINIEPL